MVTRFLTNIRHHIIDNLKLPSNPEVWSIEPGIISDERYWGSMGAKVTYTTKNKTYMELNKKDSEHTHLCVSADSDNIFGSKSGCFDLIVVFYSFETYYNQQSYPKIMNNIKKYLKSGGNVIIAGFDGERIDQDLDHYVRMEKYYKNSLIWSMEKDYDKEYNLNRPNYGFNIKYSFGKGHNKTKPLINFDHIQDSSSKYSLKVESLYPYELYTRAYRIAGIDSLTKQERDLCYYNNFLVMTN